jgi:hypothetical protein
MLVVGAASLAGEPSGDGSEVPVVSLKPMRPHAARVAMNNSHGRPTTGP